MIAQLYSGVSIRGKTQGEEKQSRRRFGTAKIEKPKSIWRKGKEGYSIYRPYIDQYQMDIMTILISSVTQDSIIIGIIRMRFGQRFGMGGGEIASVCVCLVRA